MNPTGTHAIVVGIEKYDVDETWNLNGPAVDAARFVRWLRSRGVPAKNISLFVAPLEENKAELDALDVLRKPGDSKIVVDALSSDFATREGDLLLFFWGGHGVIGEDTRRLFFSDVAGNLLRSFRFPALLNFFRSLGGFPRQVFLIDACANYFELMQSPASLADVALPSGLPSPGVSQFVLFAASAGQTAKNSNALRTGAFSSIVIKQLEESSETEWPPEFSVVQTHVIEAMLRLRDTGQVSQTPVSYTYRDWEGNEHTFRDAAAAAPMPIQRGSAKVTETSLANRDLLVDSLLNCSVMQSGTSRDSILGDLTPEIANAVARSPSNRFDVLAIVKTAARFHGGLAELIHIVCGYEGKTLAAAKLLALAKQLGIGVD